MHLGQRMRLPGTIASVVALVVVSTIALAYGIVYVSFGDLGEKSWAVLALAVAVAGFVLAVWLGTGKPPRWGGSRRGRRAASRSPLWLRPPPGVGGRQP